MAKTDTKAPEPTDGEPAKAGHNLTEKEILERIETSLGAIGHAKDRRAAINAEIEAERENLNAIGIGRKPLAMAMQYIALDEKQREGFDRAYALVRKAAGLPLQPDLFPDKG